MKILPSKDMIIPVAIISIATGIVLNYVKVKFLAPKAK